MRHSPIVCDRRREPHGRPAPRAVHSPGGGRSVPSAASPDTETQTARRGGSPCRRRSTGRESAPSSFGRSLRLLRLRSGRDALAKCVAARAVLGRISGGVRLLGRLALLRRGRCGGGPSIGGGLRRRADALSECVFVVRVLAVLRSERGGIGTPLGRTRLGGVVERGLRVLRVLRNTLAERVRLGGVRAVRAVERRGERHLFLLADLVRGGRSRPYAIGGDGGNRHQQCARRDRRDNHLRHFASFHDSLVARWIRYRTRNVWCAPTITRPSEDESSTRARPVSPFGLGPLAAR